MNKEKYLLVGRSALLTIIHSLRQIDEVRGFDNMDTLVGCVDALEKIVKGSPQVDVDDENSSESEIDPEIKAAADAARAEEESRK